MTNKEIIEAFLDEAKDYYQTNSMTYDPGNKILRTYAKILARWRDHKTIYVNMDRYSTASSTHRNLLIKMAEDYVPKPNLTYCNEETIEKIKYHGK